MRCGLKAVSQECRNDVGGEFGTSAHRLQVDHIAVYRFVENYLMEVLQPLEVGQKLEAVHRRRTRRRLGSRRE